MESYLTKPVEKQKDILFTYHDYLTSLEHESKRIISFIANTIVPAMKEYLASYRFLLYATGSAQDIIEQIEQLLESNSDLVPNDDYMENVKHGGIQSEL